MSCYVMILVMSRETCEFEFDATVNETDHAFLVIAVQMKWLPKPEYCSDIK